MDSDAIVTSALGLTVDRVAEAPLDPVQFARVILKSDLWPKQEAILRDLATYNKVAIKSCHSSGKTFLCAIAALWWLMRYDDGKVITTAPGFEQVKRVLWGEIHSAAARSIIPLPQPNQTDLRISAENEDKQNWAVGLSTNTGARFQGFHGGHMLIICDEATGIPGFIWDAIEGIRASGNVTLLMIGNPTFIGGYFFDAFTHPQKSKSWKLHTISAFDTPNFDGFTLDQCRQLPDDLSEDDSTFRFKPRPYLAKRFWAYECLRDYGETSALFQSRVLGEFPQEAEDALIPLRWLQTARARSVVEDVNSSIKIGIDVAGPGDNETVLQPVQGMNILPLKAWRGLSAQDHVLVELERHRDQIETISVDCIGVGTYFIRPLQKAGFPAMGVNVGEAPYDPRFTNKRAELYWSLRERFKTGAVAGLVDELTFLQLASIKYEEDAAGRVKIEKKEEARKRGVQSPDRADALMLAFGIAEPAMLTYYRNLAKAQADAEGKPVEPNGPAVAEIDKRKPLGDPPPPENDGADLYSRAVKRLTRPSLLCHECKQPIEGTRIEQGELKWHPNCARKVSAI